MALCCVIPNLLVAATGGTSFTFFKPLETAIGTSIAAFSTSYIPKPYKYVIAPAIAPAINLVSQYFDLDYSWTECDLRPLVNSITSAAIIYSTSFALTSLDSRLSRPEKHTISGMFALDAFLLTYGLSTLPLQPSPLISEPILGNIEKSVISGGKTFKALDSGSCVFSAGGENSIIFGQGNDIVFFSLCSTKYNSDKIPTIYNFDKNDQINLFCTKTDVKANTHLKSDLKPKDLYFPDDYTLLTIDHPNAPDFAGKHVYIAVMGHHPNLEEQVIYNTKWNDYVCPLGEDSLA